MGRGYILCATPRSGSTLLCDLLAGTGIAGRPNSFYREEDRADWADGFGVDPADETAFLAAVRDAGAGGTGIFGMRLMWESVGDLRRRLGALFPAAEGDAGLLEAAFGPIAFVHLSRRDRLAQAVSLLRARGSGLWHRHADGTERERLAPRGSAEYDAPRIAETMTALEAAERGWRAWFEAGAIRPIAVAYEDLAAAPRETLADLLGRLGLDRAAAARAAPRTARLADAETDAWVARYRGGA